MHKINRYKLTPSIIASLLCSFSLSAAAADSAAAKTGPTFYGKVFLSVDKADIEGASLITQNKPAISSNVSELNSNASRLGVKGEVPLDVEGLSAIYQVEYEVNVDDGNNGDTAFSQRNTFGGLQNEWGKIIAGKFDSPFKAAEGKIDQFNDLKADIDLLIGGQNRVANIVQYSSPKLAEAYQVNAAFMPAEDVDVDLDGIKDTALADSVSASVVADLNDSWYAALAYDGEQAARRSVDGIVRGNALRAVGIYHQDLWEAGLLVQQTRDTAPGSDKRDDSYMVSGALTLDKTKLKGQVGYSKGSVSEEEGLMATLGVDYALAKKTYLFSYLSNLTLNNSGLEDNIIGAGISHSF